MKYEDTLITHRRRLRSYLRKAASSAESDAGPLALLHNRVRSARVVRPDDVSTNVVTMNPLVVLRNLDSGDRVTCRLTYPSQRARINDRVQI